MLFMLSEILIFLLLVFRMFLEPKRHFRVETDSNILTVLPVPINCKHRDSTVYVHSNIIICTYHCLDLVLMWNEYFEHQNLQAENMYLSQHCFLVLTCSDMTELLKNVEIA